MPRKMLAGGSKFCLELPLDQHRDSSLVTKASTQKLIKESIVCCNAYCLSF